MEESGRVFNTFASESGSSILDRGARILYSEHAADMYLCQLHGLGRYFHVANV